MLYLLLPDRTMKQVNEPIEGIIEQAQANDVDMGGFSWGASDRAADDDTIRLCLRRGFSCRRGLVIEGRELELQDWPRRIRRNFEKSQQAHRALASSDDRKLNADFDAETAMHLDRALADLRRVLDEEPKTELVAHWQRLGGYLP